MDWMKKNMDKVMILSGFVSFVLWLAGFGLVVFSINAKFNEMEKEITIIKTVLIVNKIMPTELAHNGQE
jgi:hypothetical protein